MPMIAEIKEIDGDIWVKIDKMNFNRPGGHGCVTILNETEIKQMRLSTIREIIMELGVKADALGKEIYNGQIDHN